MMASEQSVIKTEPIGSFRKQNVTSLAVGWKGFGGQG